MPTVVGCVLDDEEGGFLADWRLRIGGKAVPEPDGDPDPNPEMPAVSASAPLPCSCISSELEDGGKSADSG